MSKAKMMEIAKIAAIALAAIYIANNVAVVNRVVGPKV